jgi:glycosyltransferase involved in cell wall biosynthesis
MRILLLTQYFRPETGAAQQRLADLAKRLVVLGHNVTVLTSLPNYPTGRIFDGYRGRIFLEEQQDGIRILRTWAYASPNRSFLRRLLNYFSFAFLATWFGLWRAGKQDIVVVESPPLFLGIAGLILSRLRRAPMMLNVSDLWPDSAVAMGILRNRAIIRAATALENYLYRNSYAICGQSQGIVRDIKARVPEIPVELITNGVDPDRFVLSARKRDEIRRQFGFGERCIVGYTGLHGLAQDLDTLLEAAQGLAKSNPEISVVLFGDGPEKGRLQASAKERDLNNVCFFPSQPADSMPAILSALDIAVVPLKNLPLFRDVLPAKLFECMAAKLPIVLAVDGEARQLLERANGGIYVQPENPEALADAIRKLSGDPLLRRELGENGSRYVFAHYDRTEIAQRFADLLPTQGKRTCSFHDRQSARTNSIADRLAMSDNPL